MRGPYHRRGANAHRAPRRCAGAGAAGRPRGGGDRGTRRADRRRAVDRSTTSSSAAPTRPARTTATSRAWPLLLAGLPVDVPGQTVNRLCGSGLQAVASAAQAIRAGEGDVFIAGGVESMTRAPWVMLKPEDGVPANGARRWRTRRSAGGSSTRGCRRSGRSRWARRPRKSPTLRHHARGAGRVRAREPAARPSAALEAGPVPRRARRRSRSRPTGRQRRVVARDEHPAPGRDRSRRCAACGRRS